MAALPTHPISILPSHPKREAYFPDETLPLHHKIVVVLASPSCIERVQYVSYLTQRNRLLWHGCDVLLYSPLILWYSIALFCGVACLARSPTTMGAAGRGQNGVSKAPVARRFFRFLEFGNRSRRSERKRGSSGALCVVFYKNQCAAVLCYVCMVFAYCGLATFT